MRADPKDISPSGRCRAKGDVIAPRTKLALAILERLFLSFDLADMDTDDSDVASDTPAELAACPRILGTVCWGCYSDYADSYLAAEPDSQLHTDLGKTRAKTRATRGKGRRARAAEEARNRDSAAQSRPILEPAIEENTSQIG